MAGPIVRAEFGRRKVTLSQLTARVIRPSCAVAPGASTGARIVVDAPPTWMRTTGWSETGVV